MNQKIKATVAVILAISTAATTAIILSACGENKDNTAGTTVPTTTVSTTIKTTKSNTADGGNQAQGDENGQSQNSANGSQNGSSQSSSAESQAEVSYETESDGYISEADALAEVKRQAGSGAQVTNYYKGYSPEGYEAWVVTVEPVTNGNGADTVIYYVGSHFCYREDAANTDNDDEANTYAGVTVDYARETALSAMGDPYTFDSISKGFAPDGSEAWVVYLRYEVGSADKVIAYYVSDSFGYPEDN